MKKFSFLLALLLLLQACSVYNSDSIPIMEAVAAEKKVKVTTTNDQKYKFKRLKKEDGKLIGITKSGSSTATKLAGMPATFDGKYLKFDLSNLKIEEIRLRNESSSTALTALAVAASVGLGYLIHFYISFSQSDWSFGKASSEE